MADETPKTPKTPLEQYIGKEDDEWINELYQPDKKLTPTQINKIIIDGTYQQKARLQSVEWWNAVLAKYNSVQLNDLTKAWISLSWDLDTLIEELTSKLETIDSADMLFKLESYKQFKEMAESKIDQYNLIANRSIKNCKTVYGFFGMQMVDGKLDGLGITFNHFNYETFQNFIAKTGRHSQLELTLNNSYSITCDRIESTLAEGIALGRNPLVIAREIREQDLSVPLWRSERLCRTEELQVYRETSIQTMKISGVVEKYQRIEASDCCSECAEEDGKVYELDEDLPDFHPNCRGATVPDI